jgi:hypothetical protein
VSPIKSHPDTAVLECTLDSVRHHLPDAEIIVTFDGVREEQSDRQADYDEFTRRALWLLDKTYSPALPLLYGEHRHQSGMMRDALNYIDTDLLLYVESDCPLVTDEPIDWDCITSYIQSGESNLVRLHHESHLLDAHKHMCHGEEWWSAKNGGTIRLFEMTSQWSQRPHIASVAYYRRLMESYFTPDSKAFLEDRLHGVLDEAYKIDGMAGWMQHRVHLYKHDGGNIKRSYTTDGRAGEPKWDDSQVF